MGNLRSVEKALEHVGATAAITSDPAASARPTASILPGVGAFPKAMERVRELGLDELIAERRERRRADPRHLPRPAAAVRLDSTELGGASGLGLLAGRGRARSTRRAQGPAHRLVAGALGARLARSPRGSTTETPFYFVHSFAPRPADADDVLGTAAYGERFACAVERDRRSSASSSTPRSRAPPACACSPTSPASAPSASRRDPLPGDRHPRRPGGAAAAGRLRARDGLRRRPGRRGAPLGRAKAARFLHVVDLDGAREGRPVNLEDVRRIAAAVEVPIQVGGGLRDADASPRRSRPGPSGS